VVELLRLRLDGSGGRSGGLHFLEDAGGVFIHEIPHEIEIDDFPGHDIADTRNDRNGDADGEGFGEGDLAFADVVTVRTNPEEREQHCEDYGRITDDVAMVGANLVLERDGDGHHQGDEGAGDKSEGQNCLFHWFLLKVNCDCGRTLTQRTGELSSFFWMILVRRAKNHALG